MLIQIEEELQSLIVPCSRLVAAVKRDEQRLRGRNTNNNNNGNIRRDLSGGPFVCLLPNYSRVVPGRKRLRMSSSAG